MTTDTQHAREQAEAQLQRIREMMEWLEHANTCEYGECDHELDDLMREWDFADLQETLDPDRALEAVHNSALEVAVRSGWESPPLMDTGESVAAAEYRILLSTGGPATRIVGELNEYGEPETARLEYQDWFTPWTVYDAENQHITPGPGCCEDCDAGFALVRFAQQFIFC